MEGFSDIPSQQPQTALYISLSCLQQSGTDRYAEAQTCRPQIQHKEYSENILGKENLMMKKEIQVVEEFNTAMENRMSYRLFSQTNCCCESKMNTR